MSRVRYVLLSLFVVAAIAIAGGLVSPASASKTDTRMTVMTYNVCSRYGTCIKSHDQRLVKQAELVIAEKPDVIGFQEFMDPGSHLSKTLRAAGYVNTAVGHQKIYVNTATFEVVQTCSYWDRLVDPRDADYQPELDDAFEVIDGTSEPGDMLFWEGRIWRLKPFDPGRLDHNREIGYDLHNLQCEAVGATIDMSVFRKKAYNANWTIVTSKKTGKSFFVVSAHTIAKIGKTYDRERARQVTSLIRQVKKANTESLPVVYLGDFNSGSHFSYDGPGKVFRKTGFVDSFTRARKKVRSSYDTFNGFELKPRRNGYQIDHVYVTPKVKVLRWENVIRLSGKKYARPLPSDHNPVKVTLSIPS
ncbi:hypothetical protein BH09ACT10_BH09ACT10_02030 [soil metagenome]